ncbi:hypothetical protein PMZ80_002532 [Knufia obscura]|uniref:Uncharacterized protein n=2 Tax=Knufia TaxID=430999 RepID=A0AAN8EJ53_9EURO|nr:hypothetical protein PMZ80_002532 [Knufia obscura]KAK5950760.1 hypothetical protein OHC33_008143 [Knufia fluminis]
MWPFSSKNGDERRERGHLRAPAAPAEVNIPGSWAQPSTHADEPDTDLAADIDETLQTVTLQRQRLGLHPVLRIPLIGAISFFAGFGLGSAHGSTTAALRYRAENAHRPPTSRTGWYLYGKSRNYHAIIGGVTEGVKNGGRYAAWTTLFLAIEDGLDRARGKVFASRQDREEGKLARGQRDFLNTVSAAVAFSGLYGWKHGFDRWSAQRMTRSAVRFAVPYGLAQDALASLRGDRPWYVDWVMGRTVGRHEVEQAI